MLAMGIRFHLLRDSHSPMLPVRFLTSLLTLALASAVFAAPPKKEEEDPNAPVSYFKKIRPIFQAQCQGCHQPARAKGGYVMTDFTKLVAGGDDCAKDGMRAIVPKDPAKSVLVEQITPVNGEADMPRKKPPLAEKEISLIRRWVSEGAVDDTPVNAKQRALVARTP